LTEQHHLIVHYVTVFALFFAAGRGSEAVLLDLEGSFLAGAVMTTLLDNASGSPWAWFVFKVQDWEVEWNT